MENKSDKYKIRLGLFVTAGLAIFLIAIFWIGRQKHLFNSTFNVTVEFSNISGLQVGNNVRYSGIAVGTVEQIEILSDTSVSVQLLIDKNIQKFIKQDAIASIGSEGLMGDKVIQISQGSLNAPMSADGQKLASNEPTETDEILSNLKVTSDNAAVITDQLAEIMIKINGGEGTLGRLISDTTIATNLSTTIQNLNAGTRGFNQNMEAAKDNFLLKGYYKRKEKEKKEAEEKLKKEKNKK